VFAHHRFTFAAFAARQINQSWGIMNVIAQSSVRRTAARGLVAWLALQAGGIHAQAVTDAAIRIGQTVALSGAVGEHGSALALGARAYIDKVNRGGGVNGRIIELLTLDDGGDARRATENARKLIAGDGVVALFSGAEGGPCVAVTALAGELRVPVVGCAGGSPELREPFSRVSFPIRAAHLDEFEKLVEYAAIFGRKRIGFIHSDSETGRKHLANLRRVAERHGAEVVLASVLPSGGNAFDPARVAAEIARQGVETVLNHGSYGQYAEILRASRKQGGSAQFLAVNSGAQQLVRLLGADAKGLIFSQVVPFPWFEATPIVREYRDALRDLRPTPEPSFSSMEGFVNAKVLVEALRRAGQKPTRERLVTALESMRDHDIGGLVISYAPNRHQGSRFVDVVVVASDGRFVR
jgi:ABC-type branched-subunit amino acid transport system substrate-binding protein